MPALIGWVGRVEDQDTKGEIPWVAIQGKVASFNSVRRKKVTIPTSGPFPTRTKC